MSTMSGWALRERQVHVDRIDPEPWPQAIKAAIGLAFHRPKSTASTSTTWEAATLEDEIRQIGQMTDGWDGYGAAGIESSAIAHAVYLLPLLSLRPSYAAPCSAGTILLEWENNLGRASLELGRDTFSFYSAPHAGEPVFLGGLMRDLDADDLNFALATLAGSRIARSMEDRHWRSRF